MKSILKFEDIKMNGASEVLTESLMIQMSEMDASLKFKSWAAKISFINDIEGELKKGWRNDLAYVAPLSWSAVRLSEILLRTEKRYDYDCVSTQSFAYANFEDISSPWVWTYRVIDNVAESVSFDVLNSRPSSIMRLLLNAGYRLTSRENEILSSSLDINHKYDNLIELDIVD